MMIFTLNLDIRYACYKQKHLKSVWKMLSPSHNIAHTFLLILEASLKKMYSDECTLEPQWWFVTEHEQTMISLLSWSAK